MIDYTKFAFHNQGFEYVTVEVTKTIEGRRCITIGLTDDKEHDCESRVLFMYVDELDAVNICGNSGAEIEIR